MPAWMPLSAPPSGLRENSTWPNGHQPRTQDCARWHHRTFAGNGVRAYSGDGLPASKASLQGPFTVTLDSHGSVYIATEDSRIRKVTAGRNYFHGGGQRKPERGWSAPRRWRAPGERHVERTEGDCGGWRRQPSDRRHLEMHGCARWIRTGIITTVSGPGRWDLSIGMPWCWTVRATCTWPSRIRNAREFLQCGGSRESGIGSRHSVSQRADLSVCVMATYTLP